MGKRAFSALFVVVLMVGCLAVDRAAADDLEQGVTRDLGESRTLVVRAAAKLAAGAAPASELARLKEVAESIHAAQLLLAERFTLREEQTAPLGGKAVERQETVAAGFRQALDEYRALVDALPPDRTVTREDLAPVRLLLDRLVHPRKRPLLGALPYKHLAYPSRESAASPVIVPAFTGGNRTVVPADTAPSAESPIRQEIAQLAQSLHWNPVLIYEWVKNNVETEWYRGVMKGADETLRQKSGNDADQAALLVALLRAAGFPARFVTGTIEFFPDLEKVKNLTGLDDPLKIAAFFQKAGIPFRPVVAGGRIVNFQVEHVWVESEIPYANYRGAVIDAQGKSWLALDTSIKPPGLAWNVPLDIPGFPVDSLRDDYLQGVRTETPLEFLRTRAGDYLAQHHPGTGWPDLLGTGTIVPDILKIIPASLQFRTIAVTGEYQTLPDELKHRVAVTASANGRELFATTLDLMHLSNRQVTLTYEPETVEDQRIIDSFGGLDNTPPYLVRLRPVLTLDGERVVVARDGLPMGGDYTLAIDVVTPNGTETVTSSQVAGNLSVIGIVSQRATRATALADTDDAATILFKEAEGYIDRWNRAEDELAAFLKVAVARPVPTIVIVGGLIDVTYLLDMPHGFEWRGVFIDAASRGVEVVTRTADPSREREFMRLSALQGSILENRIFEDDFPVESVSTAKLLQLAQSDGLPLVVIDRANIDTVLPPLPFDDTVKADISNAVNQGLTVTIPQNEISHRDWTGIGYVKENPETGESGWMLSGMVAGGMTAQNKAAWKQEDQDNIAEVLKKPFSSVPNKNVNEADRLLRIFGAYQDGIAGSDLKYPFQVKVVDKKLRPIQGIEVTFTVVGGGGTLKEVNSAGKAITAASTPVTVKTGSDGIARARLTLGQHTSESPLYVDAVPNSILVGHNLVNVSAMAGSRVLAAEKPFEGFAYPGETADLVKVATGQTDNIWGHVNTYSGPAWVMPVDQYGNPVSNKTVTFTAGQPQSLQTPPLATDQNVLFFPDNNACFGVPTRACSYAADKLPKYTDSSGAYVGVILGNTDNTRYPIIATVRKDTVNGNLVRQETEAELSVTFNHYSNVVSGQRGNRAYLSISGIQHVDENGNRIDAGMVGQPMATPLETVLLFHEEIDPVKGTFATTPQRTGTVSFTALSGGGSVSRPTVTEVTSAGTFATILTPGTNPGINRVVAQGSATVTLKSGASMTLADSTTMTIWGIKAEVAKDQVVFVNKDGYVEADAKLRYTVTPADYSAYSKYLVFYEEGVYMGFVPGGNGYALLSRGGAKFDITKKYTMQLVLNLQTKQEIKSEMVPLNATMLCLIPDYDHNRTIDAKDRERALNQDVYYFWVNDDSDTGEIGRDNDDIPGKPSLSQDGKDSNVNGLRDLEDFFPVFLDLKDLLKKYNPDAYDYVLKNADSALNIAFTDLKPGDAGDYLAGVLDPNTNVRQPMKQLVESATYQVTQEGIKLNGHEGDPQFLQKVLDKEKGILLVEGREATTETLTLEIFDRGTKDKVFTSSLNLSIAGVEQMFRHKNLMHEMYMIEARQLLLPPGVTPIVGHEVPNEGEPDRLEAGNSEHFSGFDAENDGNTNVFYVHGFNVNGDAARGEQAGLFKRLYWSGSKAKFWGITWFGWDSQVDYPACIGTRSPDYHINVRHAYNAGKLLREFVENQGDLGNSTFIAHSLGNMVVSTAIREKMPYFRYLMANPAIAEEAYVPEASYGGDDLTSYQKGSPWYANTRQLMFHPEWRFPNAQEVPIEQGYQPFLWSSEWYKRFPDDERGKLTWRDFFADVRTNAKVYAFFAPTDEAFRPFNYDPLANVTQVPAEYPANYSDWPGFEDILQNWSCFNRSKLGTYSWAFQELIKGRGLGGEGYDFGGWGFNNKNEDGYYPCVAEYPPEGPPDYKCDKIPPAEANSINRDQLKTRPLFRKNTNNDFLYSADRVMSAELTDAKRMELLANEIPALTFSAGHRGVSEFADAKNIDVKYIFLNNVPKAPWPRITSDYIWLHNDIHNVAYPYTYRLFDFWLNLINGGN